VAKQSLLLGCLLTILLVPPLTAQTDSVQAKKDANAITYVLYFIEDAVRIGAAPVWWAKKDWLRVGVLAAGTGLSVWQDGNIREVFQRNRNRTTNRLADALRPFGAANYVQPALLGSFAISTVAKQKKLQAFSVDAWEASQFALTVTGFLKLTTGRARPSEAGVVWQRKGFDRHSSFPSGHAVQAFVLATAVSDHCPKWWVKPLAYGLATGVALSRVNDDVHFASDVLVGAALGTTVTKTVFKRNEKRRRTPKN